MTENGYVTGILYGYGALSWSQITQLLAGYAGIWGDVDGMHLDQALPTEAPAYTHVWAWRNGSYARVRVDLPTDQHVLGLFVADGEPLRDSPPDPEEVTAAVLPVQGWGDLDRVRALAPELRNPALQRLVTQQPEPVTFVRPVGDRRDHR